MKKYLPYILVFIIAILILLLIKKPEIDRFDRRQFWDSITLANKEAKILDLSNDNKKLTTYTDSLQSLIRSNDSIHSEEITAIQHKTKKELEKIRYNYIVSGSDSSELLQEITLYKELDFCQDQRELEIKYIKKQQIKIDNLESIILEYKSKDDIYKRMVKDSENRLIALEKVYKKKLRKTKIVAGSVIGGILVMFILLGG